MLTKEESTANLAREAGIGEPALYRWREQFIEVGRGGLAYGKDHSPQRREEDSYRSAVSGKLRCISQRNW